MPTEGVPVTERAANDWHLPKAVGRQSVGCRGLLHHGRSRIPSTPGISTASRRMAGQIFRNPDLAKAFRLLQAQGRDAFYKGDIARAIVAKEKAVGGTMTMEDLADYKGEWVEPVTSDYHGFTLAELPPPSQGFAANEMLNILAACAGTGLSGADLGLARPHRCALLAHAGRGQEARLCRSDRDQWRSRFQSGPGRQSEGADLRRPCRSRCAARSARTRPRRHGPADGQRRRRHHRAVGRRPLGQHGVLGQQQLLQLRLRRHHSGLWLSAAQSRRAVHA